MNPINRLFRQAEDYFFSGISQKCLTFGEAAKAYMTGVPVANLNLVYVKNAGALGQVLSQSKFFFDEEQLSFKVNIPEMMCTSDVEEILEKMSFLKTGKSTAMAIALPTETGVGSYSVDNEVMIRVDNNLDDWMIPLIDAFESTSELTSLYAETHANALNHNLRLEHFCLYKDQEPVSAITLSIHDTIARIDDVGTLPEFQGKGYATILIKHVLLEAKKLGATYCFLEASDSGLSLHQKCGFEALFKNNIYSYSQ